MIKKKVLQSNENVSDTGDKVHLKPVSCSYKFSEWSHKMISTKHLVYQNCLRRLAN